MSIVDVLLGRERGWVHAPLIDGEYPKTVEEYRNANPGSEPYIDCEIRVSQYTGQLAVMIAKRIGEKP